jgi:hypothetical protein
LSDYVCSGCGERFDSKTHKLFFVHPNIFGGVDRLCKACVRREEKAHNKRIREFGLKIILSSHRSKAGE